MNEKQLYEITAKDLINHPIWRFPMNETVKNELTISPCLDKKVDLLSEKIIVKATFFCSNSKKYIGYIYWAPEPHDIKVIQPNLIFNDDTNLCFWGGIRKLSWNDFNIDTDLIKKMFPISYASEPCQGVPPINGNIDGLYYFDDIFNVICDKP